MSTLLHVTPRRNVPSIYRLGISPAFAVGPIAACWFCAPSRRAWAVEHIAERHGVDPSQVAVIRVNVPRSRLVRRGRGLWTCNTVVKSIRSVAICFAA